jgi:hypothetical protein
MIQPELWGALIGILCGLGLALLAALLARAMEADK